MTVALPELPAAPVVATEGLVAEGLGGPALAAALQRADAT